MVQTPKITKKLFKEELKQALSFYVTHSYFNKALKEKIRGALIGFEKKINKKYVNQKYLEKQFQLFRKLIEVDILAHIQEEKQKTDDQARQRHSELLNILDEVLKEIRDSREERVVTGKHIADHETRLTHLEATVFA